MSKIKSYTTAKSPTASRAQYWDSLLGENITNIETIPKDKEQFKASLDVVTYDSLAIARTESTSAKIQHQLGPQGPTNEKSFIFHQQISGACLNYQSGRETILEKGDFLLCDSSRPFEVSFDADTRMFVAAIPKSKLCTRIPYIEDLVCLSLSGSRGTSALLSNFTHSLWNQSGNGIASECESAVLDVFFDLLAASFVERYDANNIETSSVQTRRWLIRNYIEQNLTDPDLSPRKLSEALGYSVGYLHQLFQGEEESISRYISQRRLEKVASCLASTTYRGKSISEIAFAYGFNSSSHFGRAFKSHFGMTPRQYRLEKLDC